MTRHNDNDGAPRAGNLERARSTPLLPVVWMTSVLVWATVVALFLRVPTWAGIFLCTVTGISFLVFLVGYVHLFTSDRDALRAERWRGETPSRGKSDRQEALEEGQRTYIGAERPEFSVPPADQREVPVRVGDASQTLAE